MSQVVQAPSDLAAVQQRLERRLGSVTLETKTHPQPIEIKELDETKLEFVGYASTWDLDQDGDIIQKGAYSKTLREWKASNGRMVIPLLNQHNYKDFNSILGQMEEAEEDTTGLLGRFSLVQEQSGREIFGRLKNGGGKHLSVGFETVKSDPETRTIDGRTTKVRVIKELKLHEISLVIFPANPKAIIDTSTMKALVRSARELDRPLSEDELAEFRAVQGEIQEILKAAEPQMAPDDPARLEIENLLRSVRLRGLSAP